MDGSLAAQCIADVRRLAVEQLAEHDIVECLHVGIGTLPAHDADQSEYDLPLLGPFLGWREDRGRVAGEVAHRELRERPSKSSQT